MTVLETEERPELLDPYNLLPLRRAGIVRSISPSVVGNADVCHLRMKYSLEDPEYRTGEARAVGTAYHSGAEAYYKARMNGEVWTITDSLNAANQSFLTEAESVQSWVSSPEEAEARALTMVKAYFEGECQWPADFEVLGVEQRFYHPIPARPGWIASGVIDLVLRGPDGWVYLVDHKTSGRKWAKNKGDARHAVQPSWYEHWYRQLTGEEHITFAFDVMTYKGEFERRPAPRLRSEVQATLQKAQLVIDLIERDGPFLPNTSSNLCSEIYCDYWQTCPFGEAMSVPVEITP